MIHDHHLGASPHDREQDSFLTETSEGSAPDSSPIQPHLDRTSRIERRERKIAEMQMKLADTPKIR